MNIAAILKQHGLVPVVPESTYQTGTAPVLTAQRVPSVPAVPAESTKGATGEQQSAIRRRLFEAAMSLGIPRTVVDGLSPDELEATAEQVAMADGHRDGNGDPLARSLLTFYLQNLANQVSA